MTLLIFNNNLEWSNSSAGTVETAPHWWKSKTTSHLENRDIKKAVPWCDEEESLSQGPRNILSFTEWLSNGSSCERFSEESNTFWIIEKGQKDENLFEFWNRDSVFFFWWYTEWFAHGSFAWSYDGCLAQLFCLN